MSAYEHLARARMMSAEVRSAKKRERERTASAVGSALVPLVEDTRVAKLVLATLYAGEGMKAEKRGFITLGNSDPGVITLYLRLLRAIYPIDESKFRCTVQCRDGQDIEVLESFWSSITGIPRTQFYGARVDKRTIGKPMRRPDYKGVCRIDYFSAFVFTEVLKIGEALKTGR
jgi:hypothetical protein